MRHLKYWTMNKEVAEYLKKKNCFICLYNELLLMIK